MARKTLLQEAEIRQFMKLANLGTLSEGFLDEQEEEEMDLEVDAEADPMADLGAGDEMEVDAELDVAEDPLGDDPEADAAGDLDPEVVATVEDALTAFLQGGDEALGAAFPELAGVMSLETEEEPVEDALPPEEEVDVAAAEVGPGDEEMAAAEVEVEEDPEMPGMRNTYQEQKLVKEIKRKQQQLRVMRQRKARSRKSKSALVNEVTQRVTKRLLAESKREQTSDKIAENVIKRIQALKRS